ncbi:GntR family transcriptional regulator [Brevibacillus sp. B_LB10_24]|uniref:GntR family transcriptional regulator n=1 Tax=Brevibacillus sp. B_LB10_24 TaxID=3380645 RepID=UPI0038BC17CC
MLSKDSHEPLYVQLQKSLREYIEEHLKPGDMIPTEPEIEKTYQVSRMTVRKAIDSLVAEGLVVKQQGRGTFVQKPKITQDMESITSWTEEMRQKGKTPGTKGLQIVEVQPSKKMIAEMGLDPDESMICVKRIRCADGEPIAIMMNYLRAKFLPGFLERGLSNESLYSELETTYGLKIERADELIRAREASELEAFELEIPPDSAVLHITRASMLSDGTPVERVEMICRADRYQYRISLSGRTKQKVIDFD